MESEFLRKSNTPEEFSENYESEINRRVIEMLESESFVESVMENETDFLFFESVIDKFETAIDEGGDIQIELGDGNIFLLGEDEIQTIQNKALYKQFVESCDDVNSLNEFFTSIEE